jgi:hypothetical protein
MPSSRSSLALLTLSLLALACGPDDGDAGEATDSPDDTDTASTSEPTGTAGEPGPCDGLVAPGPANTFATSASLVHDLAAKDHRFLARADTGTNHWSVTLAGLGDQEPTPGLRMDLTLTGDETLSEQSSGLSGTATLELITVTPACVTARISDLVLSHEPLLVDIELPGGFVATRSDL